MRSSLSVDRYILEEFSEQAKNNGKTLYAFANEWLSTSLKISSEGGSAQEMMKLWRIFSVLKQVEAIILPSDFIESLILKLYGIDKAGLLSMFSRLGEDLVGIMKMVAPNIKELSGLAGTFSAVLPTKKIDINVDKDAVVVSIIGAGRKMETTECSFEFVKSILNGYGYRITYNELHVGTIMVRCEPKNY
ncbi:MAG: hypothetical protein QXK57_06125 [Conexivisphaerales archaeon]